MTAELETNLKKISSLAEPHWADNWNFRAYLQQEVDPRHLDKKVHELNREIAAAIDCTTCGNCCRESTLHMTEADVERLAVGLSTPVDDFKKLTRKEVDGSLVFCSLPCPMLRDNKCTVYAHRPKDCREYPHLHKDDFLSRSIGFIENYGCCPIVFNVWGRLKSCFPYDPSKDYIGDSDPEQTF